MLNQFATWPDSADASGAPAGPAPALFDRHCGHARCEAVAQEADVNGLIRIQYSVVLAGMVLFAHAVLSGQEPVAQNKSASVLEQGRGIERPIAGGDAHDYKVSLKAGQFLHLVVDQRGIASMSWCV
jgi:hypothetical protein